METIKKPQYIIPKEKKMLPEVLYCLFNASKYRLEQRHGVLFHPALLGVELCHLFLVIGEHFTCSCSKHLKERRKRDI